MDLTDRTKRLLDTEEIRGVLNAYCRGVDRRDWNLVRSAYHADAFDDHGSFKGLREDLLIWLQRRHAAGIEQSQHMLGQCQVNFLDAETAVAETYCRVLQRYTAEAEETRAMWGGGGSLASDERLVVDIPCRYVDRMECREAVWAIARRTVVIEDFRAQKVKAIDLGPAWTMARRDLTDVLWSELRAR